MSKRMEDLRHVLASTGWQLVVVPTLTRQLVTDIELLASLKRPEGVSDDFLRGRIEAIKLVLGSFVQQLVEFDNEQKKLKELETEHAKAEKGVGGPYDAEPDNPAKE